VEPGDTHLRDALGAAPFYSEDVQLMYSKIMNAKLTMPRGVSGECEDFIRRLLERNPTKRLANPDDVKLHPFFAVIDWERLFRKEVIPPFIPPVKSKLDATQIDPSFTKEMPVLSVVQDSEISQSDQQNFNGFTYIPTTDLST